MIIYFYLFIFFGFNFADFSSIRARNLKNDFAPMTTSDLSSLKDSVNVKTASNEPFIVQLGMINNSLKKQREEEATNLKNNMKKKANKKRLLKSKSIKKLSRTRRDVSADLEAILNSYEKKLEKMEDPVIEKKILEKSTGVVSRKENDRQQIFKALDDAMKMKSQHHEPKVDIEKKEEINSVSGIVDNNYLESETLEQKKFNPRFLFPKPNVSTTDEMNLEISKTNQSSLQSQELMMNLDRLNSKINYLKNLLKVNTTNDLDEGTRVRRKIDANKITKTFLTLSAMNGLNDKRKSKLKESDLEKDSIEDKEQNENKNPSVNAERYKVKKWIESLKNKRSSKFCPCTKHTYRDESHFSPLESKLERDYTMRLGDRSSEEIGLDYYNRNGDLSGYGLHPNEKFFDWQDVNRYSKSADNEDTLRAQSLSGTRKIELPIQDLDVYRSRAKQILKNAEEILDKIREEEEKRRTQTENFMVNLKELTSKIHSDPRNNENNNLIKFLQNNLGLGESKTGETKKDAGLADNIRSLLTDPYGKVKEITEESAKQLSTLLLQSLGNFKQNDVSTESNRNFENADLKETLQEISQNKESLLPSTLMQENIYTVECKNVSRPNPLIHYLKNFKAIKDQDKNEAIGDAKDASFNDQKVQESLTKIVNDMQKERMAQLADEKKSGGLNELGTISEENNYTAKESFVENANNERGQQEPIKGINENGIENKSKELSEKTASQQDKSSSKIIDDSSVLNTGNSSEEIIKEQEKTPEKEVNIVLQKQTPSIPQDKINQKKENSEEETMLETKNKESFEKILTSEDNENGWIGSKSENDFESKEDVKKMDLESTENNYTKSMPTKEVVKETKYTDEAQTTENILELPKTTINTIEESEAQFQTEKNRDSEEENIENMTNENVGNTIDESIEQKTSLEKENEASDLEQNYKTPTTEADDKNVQDTSSANPDMDIQHREDQILGHQQEEEQGELNSSEIQDETLERKNFKNENLLKKPSTKDDLESSGDDLNFNSSENEEISKTMKSGDDDDKNSKDNQTKESSEKDETVEKIRFEKEKQEINYESHESSEENDEVHKKKNENAEIADSTENRSEELNKDGADLDEKVQSSLSEKGSQGSQESEMNSNEENANIEATKEDKVDSKENGIGENSVITTFDKDEAVQASMKEKEESSEINDAEQGSQSKEYYSVEDKNPQEVPNQNLMVGESQTIDKSSESKESDEKGHKKVSGELVKDEILKKVGENKITDQEGSGDLSNEEYKTLKSDTNLKEVVKVPKADTKETQAEEQDKETETASIETVGKEKDNLSEEKTDESLGVVNSAEKVSKIEDTTASLDEKLDESSAGTLIKEPKDKAQDETTSFEKVGSKSIENVKDAISQETTETQEQNYSIVSSEIIDEVNSKLKSSSEENYLTAPITDSGLDDNADSFKYKEFETKPDTDYVTGRNSIESYSIEQDEEINQDDWNVQSENSNESNGPNSMKDWPSVKSPNEQDLLQQALGKKFSSNAEDDKSKEEVAFQVANDESNLKVSQPKEESETDLNVQSKNSEEMDKSESDESNEENSKLESKSKINGEKETTENIKTLGSDKFPTESSSEELKPNGEQYLEKSHQFPDYELTDSNKKSYSSYKDDTSNSFEDKNLIFLKKPRASEFEVPTAIKKIITDLNDGKEKDNITTIQSLDTEKINRYIFKIDEAETKNLNLNEDTDCKKECACVDDVDLRSRKIGRYEIVKDFLYWVKDLRMNRVLSDD